MPTYYNISSQEVNIGNFFSIAPGVTKESDLIISDARLLVTYDTPYFNPIIADDIITVSVSGTSLDITKTCKFIKIIPVANSDIKIYINSLSNTPPMNSKDTIILRNINRINKLYFTSVAGSYTINIIQLNEKIWEQDGY